MIDKKELKFILQEGEGLKIEFKESFDAKSLAKEITAFANSGGGRIFLGISDKGEIKGMEISNRLKSQIRDIANNCDPCAKIELETIDNVLVINVNEGLNKPYKCSEGFYLRQGPNSQKMKRDEIVKMILDIGNKRFDELITDVKEYDSEIAESYLRRAGINSKADKSALFNLGAVNDEGYLNNAGILFFTKNPKKHLINAYVSCVRYKGIEKIDVIDRKDFDGDLISQVENSLEFIKRNTKLSYEIKGLYRKDVPEYPVEAIREAILNAVMHRDYFEKGANVQADIFDNRLVITNFGSLIRPLTKETLGKIAVRRNPLIADLFHRIHLVEKIGSGINRIKDECRKHGNIKFKMETDGVFISEFKLIKASEDKKIRGETVEKTTQKTTQKILELIMQNPEISRRELAEKIGITEDGIKFNLNQLKEKGILKRVGPDKGGHWEVKGGKK